MEEKYIKYILMKNPSAEEEDKVKLSTKQLTRGALIAATYILLTFLLQAISFGPVQFRIAEAMTLLPLIDPAAIPGLFIGCLLSNLLCGAMLPDVIFGSLATLLAAVATRALRGRPWIAAAMPAIINGLIVGPVVYFCYVQSPGMIMELPVLLTTSGSVAAGEIVVCYTLGMALVNILKKIPYRQKKF